MLAGPLGDFNSVTAGADQVWPWSVDSKPYWAPWSVRLQENSVPSARSTTPGSCRPLPLRTGSAHQLADSCQVRPSSSEWIHRVMARASQDLLDSGSLPRERWKPSGTISRPFDVWMTRSLLSTK